LIDRLTTLFKRLRTRMFGYCRQREQIAESLDRVASRSETLLHEAVENHKRMTSILDELVREMQQGDGVK
jgi:hypothetical protein